MRLLAARERMARPRCRRDAKDGGAMPSNASLRERIRQNEASKMQPQAN